MNDISTKTGLETSGCSNQITSLISLGIIRKEIPITESSASRKTLYQLEDSMFLFWYRFVRPNISSITRGVGLTIYKTIVKPQINDFMGKIFETICQQYLFHPKIYESLPFPIGNIGRWWGNNPVKRRHEEIDIMAIQEPYVLLGECKWRNNPVDMDTVHTLLERGGLFYYPEKYYFLFSKSGFVDSVIDYVKDSGNINLVSYKQICQIGDINE